MIAALWAYLQNVVGGASHLLNALTGGDCMNSFSARVGKAQHDGEAWASIAAAIIEALLFSENHCLEHAREEGLI